MSDHLTQERPHLDLTQLAVDRTAKPPKPARTSLWLTRYALPLALLIAFAALFLWSARHSFLPATPVTITPVVVSRAEVNLEGTPLFQAAGWIEPRPIPVVVSSLASGVIDEMLVIEGQQVSKGDPIATLIDTDAKLALRKAVAEHNLQTAELQRAEATLAAARTHLAKPVELQQAALADADAQVAKTELQLCQPAVRLERGQAKQELAADNLQRKQQAGDAIAGRSAPRSPGKTRRCDQCRQRTDGSKAVARITALYALRNRRDALAKQTRTPDGGDSGPLPSPRPIWPPPQHVSSRRSRRRSRPTADRANGRPVTHFRPQFSASKRVRANGSPESIPTRNRVRALWPACTIRPASRSASTSVSKTYPKSRSGRPAMIETVAAGKPSPARCFRSPREPTYRRTRCRSKVAITEPPTSSSQKCSPK